MKTIVLLIILYFILLFFSTSVLAAESKWRTVDSANGWFTFGNQANDDEDEIKPKPIEHPLLHYLSLIFALFITSLIWILKKKKIKKTLI